MMDREKAEDEMEWMARRRGIEGPTCTNVMTGEMTRRAEEGRWRCFALRR